MTEIFHNRHIFRKGKRVTALLAPEVIYYSFVTLQILWILQKTFRDNNKYPVLPSLSAVILVMPVRYQAQQGIR